MNQAIKQRKARAAQAIGVSHHIDHCRLFYTTDVTGFQGPINQLSKDPRMFRLVWCGVVLCGVVWGGVGWCGVVWSRTTPKVTNKIARNKKTGDHLGP